MIARLASKNHRTDSASSKSRKSAARGMLPCDMSLPDGLRLGLFQGNTVRFSLEQRRTALLTYGRRCRRIFPTFPAWHGSCLVSGGNARQPTRRRPGHISESRRPTPGRRVGVHRSRCRLVWQPQRRFPQRRHQLLQAGARHECRGVGPGGVFVSDGDLAAGRRRDDGRALTSWHRGVQHNPHAHVSRLRGGVVTQLPWRLLPQPWFRRPL
jgi:hypothetical protein